LQVIEMYSHQSLKYNWIDFSSKQRSFISQNHPAGRIQPSNGPDLARGPYVWHTCSKSWSSPHAKFS